jgi:hypothetical protein
VFWKVLSAVLFFFVLVCVALLLIQAGKH